MLNQLWTYGNTHSTHCGHCGPCFPYGFIWSITKAFEKVMTILKKQEKENTCQLSKRSTYNLLVGTTKQKWISVWQISTNVWTKVVTSSIMFWWLVFLLRVGELRTWCNLMKWVSWVFLYTCSRSLVVNFVVFFTKLVDQVVKLISCCITLSLNCYWVAIVCSTRSQFEFLHG